MSLFQKNGAAPASPLPPPPPPPPSFLGAAPHSLKLLRERRKICGWRKSGSVANSFRAPFYDECRPRYNGFTYVLSCSLSFSSLVSSRRVSQTLVLVREATPAPTPAARRWQRLGRQFDIQRRSGRARAGKAIDIFPSTDTNLARVHPRRARRP